MMKSKIARELTGFVRRVSAMIAIGFFVVASFGIAVAADYPGQGAASNAGAPTAAGNLSPGDPLATPAPGGTPTSPCIAGTSGCDSTNPPGTLDTPGPSPTTTPFDPSNPGRPANAELGKLSGVLNGASLGITDGWMGKAQHEAGKLFQALFPLEIIVTGVILIFKAHNNAEVITVLTMKFLAASCFIYLINQAPVIFNAIPNFFVSEANIITGPDGSGPVDQRTGQNYYSRSGVCPIPTNGSASTCDPLSPGFMVTYGLNLAGQIMERSSRGFFQKAPNATDYVAMAMNPGSIVGSFVNHALLGAIVVMPFVVLSQVIIIAAYIVMAAMLAVTEMEAQILGTVGALVLGFAGFRYTSSYSEKFISLAFSVGAKLFMMFVMAAVGTHMMHTATTTFLDNSTFSNPLSVLMLPIVAAFVMILFWKVPQLANSFTSGSVGMNLGQIVQTAAAVAGAAVATAAAVPAAGGMIAKGGELFDKAKTGANALKQAAPGGGASKALNTGSDSNKEGVQPKGAGASNKDTKNAIPPTSPESDVAHGAPIEDTNAGDAPAAPGAGDQKSKIQPPESKTTPKGKSGDGETGNEPPAPADLAPSLGADVQAIADKHGAGFDGSDSPERESISGGQDAGGDSAKKTGAPRSPKGKGGKKKGKGRARELAGVGAGGGADGGDGAPPAPPAGSPGDGSAPPPPSDGSAFEAMNQQLAENNVTGKQTAEGVQQLIRGQEQSTKQIVEALQSSGTGGGGSLASRMAGSDSRELAQMIGEQIANQLSPKPTTLSGKLFNLSDRMKKTGSKTIGEIQAVAMASSVAGQSGHVGGHNTGAHI